MATRGWRQTRTIIALVAMYGLVLQTLLLGVAQVTNAVALDSIDPHALCRLVDGDAPPNAPANPAHDSLCVRCVTAAMPLAMPVDPPAQRITQSARPVYWIAQPGAIAVHRPYTPHNAQAPPHVV